MTLTKDPEFPTVWDLATGAIVECNAHSADNNYERGEKYWHIQLQSAFALHPVVETIVQTYMIRPKDWQQLLLEWPHVSTDNPSMLAYSRDEKAGEDFLVNGSKRQTRTTIGKYVSRHWPHVPAHTLRDWVALYTPDTFRFADTVEDIISSVELGPQSCMVSRYCTIPFNSEDHAVMCDWMQNNDRDEPEWDKHPYAVYAPKYGWSLCVHMSDSVVQGRGLCWTDPDDPTCKLFVRTYTRGKTDDDRSETDTTMASWLCEQGFQKVRSWPEGVKFRKLEHPDNDDRMMPYLDGEERRVCDAGRYMVMDYKGEYICDNTNGTATLEEASLGSCEDCGDTIHEGDDYSYVGRNEEEAVCESCVNHHYTYVRGASTYGGLQSYREYYIPDRDACGVTGHAYSIDLSYPPEDIVELENGDYAELDDTIDIDDAFYLPDDYRLIVVEEEHHETSSTYALKDDCWQDNNGDWHRDDIECVELDGEKYTREDADEIINEKQVALELA